MSTDGPLLDVIRQADATHQLFEVGETLVVGVSGGADSVALLDALRAYAPQKGLRLHLAHLDHMLREGGVVDAAWVNQLAADWDLPATVFARDVGRFAARLGRSVEDAARTARYAFMARVAAEQGARSVVVAHHADDQAETVLMNFLRGTGLDGLKGMTPISDYPLDATAILAVEDLRPPADLAWPPRLIRPLLAIGRQAVREQLRARGLEAREDESNRDPSFLRNRLRHELLPRLEVYNPRLREALTRNARAIAGDLDFVEQAVDAAWQAGVERGPGRVHVPLAVWRGLHPAIQRRLLRRAVLHLGASTRELGLDPIEAARELVASGAGEMPLPGGLRLRVGPTGFDLAPGGLASIPPPPAGPEMRLLEVPGDTAWPGGWTITAELRDRRPGEPLVGRDPWRAAVDAERLVGPLALRGREPGDRMQPLGMGGRHKSLQDLFVDAQVPREARETWPILMDGPRVLWVPGLRLDERARLGPSARRLLVLRCRPPTGYA